MKKKLFTFLSLPVAILGSLSLFSCNKSTFTGKVHLDYGRYYSERVDTFPVNCSLDAFEKKLKRKESFPIIVYEPSCSCWSDFQEYAFTDYVNDTGVEFVIMSKAQLEDKPHGLYLGSSLMMGIFNNGSLVYQISYDKNISLFKQKSEFYSFMEDHIELPNYYWISRSDLETFYNDPEKEYNLYIAGVGCPDCGRVNTTIQAWQDKYSHFNEVFYVFDVFIYKDVSGTKTEDYFSFMNQYGLSSEGNEYFGWNNGYVPTFQHRKGSQVLDAITTHNDKQDEGSNTVISYFSEERLPHLLFLKDDTTIANKVLDGMEYKDYWGNREKYESKYINPIVKLFIETYTK